MEYTQVIQAQLRHDELMDAARIGRLSNAPEPGRRDRSERRSGTSHPTAVPQTIRPGAAPLSWSAGSASRGSSVRALALYAAIMRCWYIQIEATSY
jgi:hypothetical protein